MVSCTLHAESTWFRSPGFRDGPLAVLSSRTRGGGKESCCEVPESVLSPVYAMLWVAGWQAGTPSGRTEVSKCLAHFLQCVPLLGRILRIASGSLGCKPSGDDFSILPGRDMTVACAGRLLSQSEWGSVLRTGLVWGGRLAVQENMCVSMGFHDPHLETAPGLALETNTLWPGRLTCWCLCPGVAQQALPVCGRLQGVCCPFGPEF